MIFGTVFEMLGAITVGARTADTIKNGIIPTSAFRGDAGVQMLAFTCALAAASTWVMWCTRHSAHVSSTYSLISAVAGVGVATAGASKVQWGWNKGKGLGAIFAGLGMVSFPAIHQDHSCLRISGNPCLVRYVLFLRLLGYVNTIGLTIQAVLILTILQAPAISAGFAASIFMLIKLVVHVRKNPMPWAINTSPFFFLIAGTICTLSIIYKGSPNLGLNKKPAWYVAAVTMGTGSGVAVLAALFFVPFVHAKIIKKDPTIKWWMCIQGPLLFKRPAVDHADRASVPNYAVVQDDEEEEQHSSARSHIFVSEPDLWKDEIRAADSNSSTDENEKKLGTIEAAQADYKEAVALSQSKLHAKLLKKRGPFGWAMRTLHNNPMGEGRIYEVHNMKIALKRLPAMVVCGALYGLYYNIHAAQSGIAGTPEGKRMARVYSHAKKYLNEVEHTYSFVQILTACTASFAHGANDIGNSVGPWAVIYGAWHTGNAAASKAPVPIWQLAVLSAMISLGLITYGYNIMKGASQLTRCLLQIPH